LLIELSGKRKEDARRNIRVRRELRERD
jgi:hypothetical protein